MSKKIKKSDNFLDLVPVKNESKQWKFNDDNMVQIIIPRDGILDKIVRVIFKTPKVMKIDLDDLGTTVWTAIDGKKTVEEIGKIVKLKFGEKAEPLYQRLGTYINILRNNKFITLELNK